MNIRIQFIRCLSLPQAPDILALRLRSSVFRRDLARLMRWRCGKQGFNMYNTMNWLVMPAHATAQDCSIYLPDGQQIELGVKTIEECKFAVKSYLSGLSRAERNRVLEAAGFNQHVSGSGRRINM